MQLSIVVAASENNVIGVGNELPWRLPADLKHFKHVTMGKPLVMGRKTFDSIGMPLPGRLNIVVSRDPHLRIHGAVTAPSISRALDIAAPAPEVMIIGGGDIFRQVLDRTHRIYFTRVHTTLAGDALFPELDPHEWREVAREPHPADERHPFAYTFLTLERMGS